MIPIDLPRHLDDLTYAEPDTVLAGLIDTAALSETDRAAICSAAADLVRRIRSASDPGLMEVFLAEYGLSTDEGVALMCLAEALLRVPDADTMDALIEDKIAASDWGHHLGQSSSALVNASTWALMLTGRVLEEDTQPDPGLLASLRGAIKRLGEPVIRTAVSRAMKEMGRQFVLGESIQSAMERAAKMEAKGFTYSYDMLGEAAMTDADAKRYHLSYSRAIAAISSACTHGDIRANPGISVKLSALHPRYELAQADRVMAELFPRLRSLAQVAASAGMGLNVDAEEADRLTLSMAVVEKMLEDPALAGWDGFGVVVQAFGPRTATVLDHLYALAQRYDRRIMVRLVKGAYWDTEVKRAQVEGLDGFPVYARKPATDVSYIANARKLLGMTDRIYPQFATHNAHTVAAILHMADDPNAFEFQRLHGMGEALHKLVMADHGTRCRIYAPVGAHKDLLAYLVRRLLENGANSSFVNQIVDQDVAPEEVAADPFAALASNAPELVRGPDLFAPERRNSRGFDLKHTGTLADLDSARSGFETATWQAAPILAGTCAPEAAAPVPNPARPDDQPGTVAWSSAKDVETALSNSASWTAPREDRARILNRAADLYETHHAELFALLAREAGKCLPDCVAELREAVDFLRYYAANAPDTAPVGVFTCISPWNFPLAIFTGQIAAALAAGNGVLAKPAEQTPLIAFRAVQLLHEAGVPLAALQLLPGAGEVGAALTSDARIGGVAFTGGTDTARLIRRAMADHLAPGAPLIAETGGLNAMIVDSTALPEQAARAVIESAFQSAGQRCSALRCLYVQKDIAEDFQTLLMGAMDALRLGNPWDIRSDIGPVIDADAHRAISEYVDKARLQARVLHQIKAPSAGHFIAPTLIRVDSIAEMEREVFGPVLHMATFASEDLDRVIDDINATGYGLTFGLQTRIDDRVQYVTDRIHAGNLYVNRNQIGAIVGSQPFGGEGLSGTGPKAGGPLYLSRFSKNTTPASLPETQPLPGPTGELNQYSVSARPPLLCLGPGADTAAAQAKAVRALGGDAIEAPDMAPAEVQTAPLPGGVLWWGDAVTASALDQSLARRDGPLVRLILGDPIQADVLQERHLCVDTTAAGGNAALLAAVSEV